MLRFTAVLVFCGLAYGQDFGIPLSHVSMTASLWNFESSSNVGMPSHPTQVQTPFGGWSFNFPTAPSGGACYDSSCPRVGYIMTNFMTQLTTEMTITIEFEVTASRAVFDYRTEAVNTCDQPAGFHIMVEHIGDEGHLASHPYWRWWADQHYYVLQDGAAPVPLAVSPVRGTYTVPRSVVMRIPLNPALWSSVFGEAGNTSKAAAQGFSDTLANIGKVGLTFGGGCFFGHGAYLDSGIATFTLIEFGIRKAANTTVTKEQ